MSAIKDLSSAINNYLHKKDLHQLYTLDRILNNTLTDITVYLSSDEIPKVNFSDEILFEHLEGCFPDVFEYIDYDDLAKEIQKIKSSKKRDTAFKNTPLLNALVLFQKHTHGSIEKFHCDDWRAKPEAFLRSFANYCPNYTDEEAIIYLESRSIFCDEAINQIRERYRSDLKEDFTSDFNDQASFLHSALYLRLKQWGIVDVPLAINEMVPKDIQGLTYDFMIESTGTLFPFFRFLNAPKSNLRKSLEKGLQAYEQILHDIVIHNIHTSLKSSPLGSYHALSLGATYVFGMHQLGIDSPFLKQTIEYLTKPGQLEELWQAKKVEVRQHRDDITTMIIHALAVTRHLAQTENTLEIAKEKLRTSIGKYGIWGADEYASELTSLILDSFDLTEGLYSRLTFSVSGQHVLYEGKLSIDETTQTIVYKGQKFHLGGQEEWGLFVNLFYSEKGLSKEEIIQLRGRQDTHAVIGELKKALRKAGCAKIAGAIENIRTFGYYIDSSKL